MSWQHPPINTTIQSQPTISWSEELRKFLVDKHEEAHRKFIRKHSYTEWLWNIELPDEYLKDAITHRKQWDIAVDMLINSNLNGVKMNCLNAKLGDRFYLKVSSKTYMTNISGDTSLPATIIGIHTLSDGTSDEVLIGWSHKDAIRPGDSHPLTVHSIPTSSYHSYLDNVEEYSFGVWKNAKADIVVAFMNVEPVAAEWKCCLPGCQKMNDNTVKSCYMCGNTRA